MPGILYLIPTPLGDNALHVLPDYMLRQLRDITVFITERGKTARHFLKAAGLKHPLQSMTFFELNKYTNPSDYKRFLAPAIDQNQNIGLMSEAGCPGVADPGAVIVEIAHQRGIKVVPLVGPSSILLALMASGMNGQQFAFNGYLPQKPTERKKALKEHERQSFRLNQTQLFIETPYRNNAFVENAISTLKNNTLFGIATDLTLKSEFVCTLTIGKWKNTKLPDLHKRPTIFLLLAR